jgi:hypothetical protein
VTKKNHDALKRARRRKRQAGELPAWTPFKRVYEIYNGELREWKTLPEEGEQIWLNSRYQVHLNHKWATGFDDVTVTYLSIKNVALGARHDWRDFQRIKNELCGPEREGIEIYPAESRLLDEADQFHLWVFEEGNKIPIGHFEERSVSEEQPNRGSQRLFELKPPELA